MQRMNAPQLDAFGERELLESGPCGAVFRAVRSDGAVTAVKLLDGMAINRQLLEMATARLERGGWPDGVVEVLEADFRTRPAVRVTPCFADRREDGSWVPRSLQHRLADHPGDQSWNVVLGIADSLAALHDRQVAHGNLKPGNVFFDDEGRVVVADWALGNMPGIAHHQFTDAVLYQPPEQLRSPDGYQEEQGYRWDTYAFGVLAYRLVTGKFPRSDQSFAQVAPPPGETHRDGIAADLPKIAAALEKQEGIEWPSDPANELERQFREVIDRCLALDPLDRPANGLELRRLFNEAELEIEEEERRDSLLDQRRRAQRSAARATVAAGCLLAALVLTVILWTLARTQLLEQGERHRAAVSDLSLQAKRAIEARDEAVKSEAAAKESLQSGESTWLARIEASRAVGDRLFTWAIEQGRGAVPPLDGRDQRLTRLEDYFVHFLDRTDGISGLEDERARARLQLAEISLSKGEPEKAEQRLEEALKYVIDLDKGAELDLRVATDRLVLAILLQSRGDERVSEAFAVARAALERVPLAEVDADRVSYLLATLDIHESELLAAAGNEGEALQNLHRATRELNRLADERPDASVLRSELVACYLSSANILDGMGELGDARGLRELAAGKLLDLIKERPENLNLRLELAGCYGAIAESALIAGDVTTAESMSKGAVKLLTDILPQRPDSALARSRLAAQRGLMAGILRDRGKSEEAMELYDEGLRLIEGMTVGENADPVARFRYALLTWEKGRMLGFSGDRDEEITHLAKAESMLQSLEDTPYGVGHGEQIQRTLGYVLGDLGHSYELAGKRDKSAATFEQAVEVWEELHRDRPASEEYEEVLAWNLQRLAEFRQSNP